MQVICRVENVTLLTLLLKSLFFLRKLLRKHSCSWGITLSWPAWLPDCSKHTLILSGSETQGLQSFYIIPSASPPSLHLALAAWRGLQLSPHTSHPYSEESWCPNGIRAFLFLHWRQEESAGDNCVLWLCSRWGIFFTPHLSTATARVLRTVFLSKNLLGWLLFCME